MTVIPERCAWCAKYDFECSDATHGNPVARYLPIIERMDNLTVMQLSAIPVVPGRDADTPRTVAAAGVTYRASTYTPVRTINPLAVAVAVAGLVFGLILVAYAITRPGPATPACVSATPSCVHTIPAPPKDGPR